MQFEDMDRQKMAKQYCLLQAKNTNVHVRFVGDKFMYVAIEICVVAVYMSRAVQYCSVLSPMDVCMLENCAETL
jgi:hypothetical protein